MTSWIPSPGIRPALTVVAILLSAHAGTLIAAAPLDGMRYVELAAAVLAAMACGATAAWLYCADSTRRDTVVDAGEDITREIPVVESGAARSRASTSLRGIALVPLALVVLALPVLGVYWSERTTASAVPASTPLPVASAIPTPVATPAVQVATPALQAPTAPVVSVDPSRARRECLAQIESAHLFLMLARKANRPSTYTSATRPEIEQLLKSNRVPPRTLEHIALRMWEQRDAPERGPAWWSSQYASCEAARLAGAGYVVRG
jgi:hypothetical protein